MYFRPYLVGMAGAGKVNVGVESMTTICQLLFVVIGRVPNPHKYIQAFKSVRVGGLSPQDL